MRMTQSVSTYVLYIILAHVAVDGQSISYVFCVIEVSANNDNFLGAALIQLVFQSVSINTSSLLTASAALYIFVRLKISHQFCLQLVQLFRY